MGKLNFRNIVVATGALSVLSLVLLPAAALGHRASLLSLTGAFNLLAFGVVLGVLAAVVSIYLLIRSLRQGLMTDAAVSGGGLAACAILLTIVSMQAYRAFSVPAIHDITTDVVNVPYFDAVRKLRSETDNSLAYAAGELRREDYVELQKRAYPDIKTIHSDLTEAQAFDRSLELLKSAGMEVVSEDRKGGRIEAVATTFWFGFKDDVVVRIIGEDEGCIVDLRSVSRLGQSDLGMNAARIRAFIEGFKGG